MFTYEKTLDLDSEYAMSEGSRFFEERSAVQEALRKVTRCLGDLEIDYVVVGGMALFMHGFRRFTEDVNILVTSGDLKMIHRELEGLGYVHPFEGSRNLRDAASGVKIEFLIAGQFPGDGRPKPVAFPKPAEVALERDGVKYVNLPTLVELKLASGMTNLERVKDLADVQELIKILSLPVDFGGQLSPYVQTKFRELWTGTRQGTKRYLLLWRNKFPTTEAKSLAEIAAGLHQASDTLDAMLADGIKLENSDGVADDRVYLMTTDPEVAKKYDMHDEAEFWEGSEIPDAPL